MVRSIRLQWWLLWSVLTLAQMTSVHSKKIKRLRKGRNDGNSMNALTDSQIEEHLSQTVIQADNSVVLTEVVVAFGYNVRYDTDSIAEDQMPHCLETSTTNLLLYNFGCDSEISMHSRRQHRHLSLRGTTSNVAQRSRGFETSEEQRLFAELLLRDQENRRLFDTVMSMDPSCNYIISTEVSTIIPQDCDPPPPVDSSISCGLVRSSVEVSAPQTLEPDEEALRTNVTEALRLAIDGDTFEDFFPMGCLLERR